MASDLNFGGAPNYLDLSRNMRTGGRARRIRWLIASLIIVPALLILTLFVLQIFGVRLIGELHPLGERIAVHGMNPAEEYAVYYGVEISKSRAQRLADALTKEGTFAGPDGATVTLWHNDGKYIVSFVVSEFAWHDPKVIQYYTELRDRLSHDVFDGKPVQVQLCDSKMDLDGVGRGHLHVWHVIP